MDGTLLARTRIALGCPGCRSEALSSWTPNPIFQIKLWRLSGTGDALPSVPGVVLGPEELPVEVLQFHPTSDGVLVSTAGRAVKVWDVAKQQPLTGMATLEWLPFSASPHQDNPSFLCWWF